MMTVLNTPIRRLEGSNMGDVIEFAYCHTSFSIDELRKNPEHYKDFKYPPNLLLVIANGERNKGQKYFSPYCSYTDKDGRCRGHPQVVVTDICSFCQKPKAPFGYDFPERISDEKKYCACVEWQTLDRCIILSIESASRLLEDAELLLKKNRLATAEILLASSKEEIGRVEIAIEYFVRKSNIPKDVYRKQILDHKEKLKAFQKFTHPKEFLEKFGDHSAQTQLERKLSRAYVDYDFDLRKWRSYWDFGLDGILGKMENKTNSAVDDFWKLIAKDDVVETRKVIDFLRKYLEKNQILSKNPSSGRSLQRLP